MLASRTQPTDRWLRTCFWLVDGLEARLAHDARRAARHARDPELQAELHRLAGWSEHHSERVRLLGPRYGEHQSPGAPARRPGGRAGALLDQVQDLYVVVTAAGLAWGSLAAAAEEAGDRELVAAARGSQADAREAARSLARRLRGARPVPEALAV